MFKSWWPDKLLLILSFLLIFSSASAVVADTAISASDPSDEAAIEVPSVSETDGDSTSETHLPPSDDSRPNEQSYEEAKFAEATVVQILKQEKIEPQSDAITGPIQPFWQQEVKVQIYEGEGKGTEIIVNHTAYQQNWVMKKGDRVTLSISTGVEGNNFYQISGFVRRFPVYWFTLAFIMITVMIGGFKSLRSLIGLVISVAGVYGFLLPAILDGKDPLLMSGVYVVLVSLLVVPIALGISTKSLTAIIGIIGGSITAICISIFMGGFLHLSGIDDEDSMLLMMHIGENFDFRGILFAGVLISSMGAVNDVAISIASSMQEVSKSLDKVAPIYLMRSGMNVGRDIIGSMIDTLVLAYVGSSLPMVLLFMARDLSFNQILNFDFIVIEILRSLAGSLGLVIAVPITVFFGSILMGKKPKPAQIRKY